MTNEKQKVINAIAGLYSGITDTERYNECCEAIGKYEFPIVIDNKTIFDFLKCVENARGSWLKGDNAQFHLQREAFIEFACLIIEKITR